MDKEHFDQSTGEGGALDEPVYDGQGCARHEDDRIGRAGRARDPLCRRAVSAQDFMISPYRLPITDHGGSPVRHLPFAVHRRVDR